MDKKVALITGITGQDGSYLAEFLLKKGYVVHGVKRRTSLFNTDRIDHLYQDPHVDNRNFFLHYGDMTDSMNLTRIIQEVQPDEIYNLAAMSHVHVSFETPEYVANADGTGTLRLLEAIRILGLEKKTKIYQASTSELCNAHVTTNRPWGNYTVLENQDGYKIKIIEVKPGKRLSLQKHFHRNEHWIVLSGSATVTIGETTRLVCPNESIYIKMGEVHRLSNEGKIPVVLIEAQVGEYTGEDDIIRLDDDFKR